MGKVTMSTASARALVAMLLFTAMCCSHGRDREPDEQHIRQLREHDGVVSDMPRRVREEVFDNRRGPAWLAKLPQRLQRGERGNRPFAVQDARVSRGPRAEPVPQTPLRGDPQTSAKIETGTAVLAPNPGNSISPMRPRTTDLPVLNKGRGVVAYEQEEQWRQRAREAWNSMLENARVGILSKGKLIVEPRLAGSASSIMAAALNGNVELLKSALDEAGANIGVTNSVGETPLMLAAISGNPDGMAVLLARGADLNTRDMHGWTALMKAVALGDDAAVDFLLSAGADTEVRNIANQTACGIAGKWGRAATERLLIGAGACPAPIVSDGQVIQRALAHARPAGTPAADEEGDLEKLRVEEPVTGKRNTRSDGAKSAPWKLQADVRLEWQLEKERDAQEWIEQLAASHERHLTQYRIIKGLEQQLHDTERRLARAEQMLDVCQADLSEETRRLLDDYHRRLEEACGGGAGAHDDSSSSPASSSFPSSASSATTSSSMSGCESCEVEFYPSDSAEGSDPDDRSDPPTTGGLVLHTSGKGPAQVDDCRGGVLCAAESKEIDNIIEIDGPCCTLVAIAGQVLACSGRSNIASATLGGAPPPPCFADGNPPHECSHMHGMCGRSHRVGVQRQRASGS
jgi:hypothetical protein